MLKKISVSKFHEWQKVIPEPDNPNTAHDFEKCPRSEATHFTYRNGLKSCTGKPYYSRALIEQLED